MKFEVVQCLVTLTQNGKSNLTQVVKAGPGAIRVTEIPILRFSNDIGDDDGLCCIADAKVVGEVEDSRVNELDRLRERYGRKVVDLVYPGAAPGMPKTLHDCDLPTSAIGKPATGDTSDAEAKKALRAELKAAGIKVPAGNLSLSDLEVLLEG